MSTPGVTDAPRTRARRSLAPLALLFAACACAREGAPAPRFELADVVAPALAELGGCADSGTGFAATAPGPVPGAAGSGAERPAAAEQAADAALPEELLGMLDTLTVSASRLREPVLEDLRQRGARWVEPLARHASDPLARAETRAAALEALATIDSVAAADALVTALTRAREPWIRAQCAWRLAATRHDRFLPRIVLRLKYEADEETVVWLAECLARHGNFAGVEGVRVVRERARTEELVALADARLAALAELAGCADPLALEAEWRSGALERRRPPAAPSPELACETWRAIEALEQWDLRVVDDRRFALSHLGAWVVAPLARALHERNVYRRTHAAQCLERMGPRAAAAAPELLAALDEPRVAPAAAAALGALGDVAACPRLEQALEAADLELACAAARALGALGAPRSIEPLRRALAPPATPDLRQAAAESLLALDARDVVAFLVERVTAERAENVAAEAALERWLARRAAAGDAGFAERLERWRALDTVPPGAIATREQLAARLSARAALARGW